MLTNDLRLGGAERVILNLMRCLRERGVQSAVIGLFERQETRGWLRRHLESDGFQVACLGVESPVDLWRLPALGGLVRSWTPDILHAFLFHSHVAAAGLRWPGWMGPTVWTYESIGLRVQPWRHGFYRLCAPLADAHVFASRAVRRYWYRGANPTPNPAIIYNGLDLEPFLAVRPEPGPVFGAVGRLVPLHKGFDILIRALAQLSRERPEARLRIAGDGPERGALEGLARSLGVAERVEFAGLVEDVPAFLSDVNIFVNPSRWEAFGNTLVEGMAAGLPCIATRIQGLAEAGGDLVRWVPPGDVDALRRAMRRMLDAPPPGEHVARQRRRVIARFGQQAMTDRYVDVYRSALSGGPGGRAGGRAV